MELSELKSNKRLIEVRAAYALNRIYNYINRKHFKEHLTLLECLVESFDENNKDIFLNIVKNSVGENILGASKKEIFAAMKVRYIKTKEIMNKLGSSRHAYYNVYKDLSSRNFITEDFVKSLQPILDDKGIEICAIINNFIDNFTYLTGDDYFNYYDKDRTLELEFLIIYNKLVEILQSPRIIENFIYKVCVVNDIDWGTISYLIRNINFINREHTNQIMGRQQTRLELFNLFYLKGFNKSEIGRIIFNKNPKIYYQKGYESSTKDITNDEWQFSLTYTPTLDWKNLNKNETLKFIALFKGFVNEGL